jgi:hypothetical protein
MKHTKWVVGLTLMVLSGMAAAQLMGNTKIAAEVPFEFVVANKIVPAGECVVRAATMDGKILMIDNAGAKVGLYSGAFQTESKQGASHSALVFKQYGDRYFLTSIKLQGSKIAYRLPESRAEAELRAQNTSATELTLVAALK